ncbi:hypothetical protein ACN4GJ_27630, partial [Burkholderia pseudomallei]
MAGSGRPAAPVIAVAGMAFEARIARGAGVEAVYAARADRLERALAEAARAHGCAGIVSFGTAGGLAPDLARVDRDAAAERQPAVEEQHRNRDHL